MSETQIQPGGDRIPDSTRVATDQTTIAGDGSAENPLHAIGSGALGVDVQDEGVPVLTPALTLNFVGAGVVATDGGAGTATVTIPGGIAGISVDEAGDPIVASATIIDFSGAGVAVTSGGAGHADVAISGAPIMQLGVVTTTTSTLTSQHVGDRFLEVTVNNGGGGENPTLLDLGFAPISGTLAFIAVVVASTSGLTFAGGGVHVGTSYPFGAVPLAEITGSEVVTAIFNGTHWDVFH